LRQYTKLHQMKTYITLFYIKLKEYFAYRLNFIMWRFRMIFSTFITMFLWIAVYESRGQFGSYSKYELLTYILLTGAIMALSTSTRTTQLASEINDGSIMNVLLKPVSVFKLYATNDAVDKVLNGMFSILELMLVAHVLQVPLIAPHLSLYVFFFIICGVALLFFINLLLSFVAFWTTEIWAPRFIFFTVIFFVSGAFFPLDLLPEHVYNFLLYTPIPYFFFLPGHVMVKGVNPDVIGIQIISAVVWVFGLYAITRVVWKKGISEFSFWGK